jgi:hypothetical protein
MRRPRSQEGVPGNQEPSDRAKRLRGTVLAPIWGAAVVASLVGVVYQAREYLAFPEAPRRTTLEDAHAGEWVELEAQLHCRTARTHNRSTYILGRSAGRPFVAVYSGNAACLTETRPTGVLLDVKPRLARTLRDAGFELADGVVQLCTYCGPRNSALGMAMMLFFAFASALFTGLALKLRRSGRTPRPARRVAVPGALAPGTPSAARNIHH